MPEQKPVQSEKKKDSPKVVPESDLIAFKKGALDREKRLKEELAEVRVQLNALASELKVAHTDVEDDEEVKKVKEYLLSEEKRIQKERAKLETDVTAHKERERAVRASELATEYGIDKEAILAEEDIEVTAIKLHAEKLAKEVEELKEKQPSPESVYETGTGGKIKVAPADMSQEDFDAHYEQLKRDSLSKR